MQKFTTYRLYGTNAHGAEVTVVIPDNVRREVYLASDVDAELARLRDIISPGDAAAYEEGMAALQARIAQLEQALRKYGGHDAQCDYIQDTLPCSCGFEELRLSLGKCEGNSNG